MERTDQPAPAEPPRRLADGDASEVHACWNEIGVHGDGTCPELQKHLLCRNCPVYSTAGVQLLNRPLPAEYRRQRNADFALQKRPAAPRLGSAVVFRITTEWFALPTEVFQEAAEERPVHTLPHRRTGIVLGLVNIRGELLICVSLSRVLGLEPSLPARTPGPLPHRLLVGDWGGSRFVFPVDEIGGIHRFDPQQLQAPPATLARSNVTFTRGILTWERRTVGLLDPNLLFAALNRSLQ
jgi:chemotaxis-related protein WspD